MNWRRRSDHSTSAAADATRKQGDEHQAVANEVQGLFGRDSLYMLLWALQLVLAAALTPVTTRILGPEQFGAVAAAMAVMQVAAVLAGVGLQTAIQRQHGSYDDGVGARRLLTLSIVGSLFVVAALEITGPAWSRLLGFPHYGGAVRFAVLWAGFAALTTSALALLRSQDRLLFFTIVSLVQSVVAEVTAVCLVLTIEPTATMFILGELLGQIAAVTLALIFVPPAWLRLDDRVLVKAGLLYALPLVPAALSNFVLGASDRLIVQDQLGATAVARYQIAYNIGSMPMILLDLLDNVWMARIFGLRNAGLRAEVLRASRDALYRLLAPLIVGLSLGAPLMLRLWAPPAYQPDKLLAVTSVVIVCALPYTAGLALTRARLAEGRSTSVAVASGVAALVNVLLNLVLVPRFGLLGAAVATLLAFVLLHVVLLVSVGHRPVSRRPTGRLLLVLALACGLTLLSSMVPTAPGFLVLRVLGTVACVAWFFLVLVRVSHRQDARPC